MNQDEKSQRSRTQILDAALKLFSHQGYRGTSIRDIAIAAGLSTGNVYHHFPDKESLFRTLLDQYWRALETPEFPVNRALLEGAFPDDIEALGRAARESLVHYRDYVALIYVDVVEFDGTHIRMFYQSMAQRFEAFLATQDHAALQRKLRPDVSALSAIMLTTRMFLNYFTVETLFGVPNHFGKDSDAAVREIAEILRHGLMQSAATTFSPDGPGDAASGAAAPPGPRKGASARTPVPALARS